MLILILCPHTELNVREYSIICDLLIKKIINYHSSLVYGIQTHHGDMEMYCSSFTYSN